ncbi:MAG: ABC transporter ATP-binding protein, partial [Oscillospiraceae bacterium]|nr:ABC transporter ATP-binding protein [Oscillospiraceae bacterium]
MDKQTMVKVDNVGIRFNLAKERVDSLKEYFLKFSKGTLKFEEFWALDGVSLEIEKGDFYGLVGINGSGKSTLLKAVAGVFKPTRGKITVNGTIAP